MTMRDLFWLQEHATQDLLTRRRLWTWSRSRLPALLPVVLALTLVPGVITATPTGMPNRNGRVASAPVTLQAAYTQRPLQFEANQGQADKSVDFLARGPGYTLFLTPAEAVLSLQSGSGPTATPTGERAGAAGQSRLGPGHVDRPVPNAPAQGAQADVMRVQLMGGSAGTSVGEAQLSGTVNYLLGDDPTLWRTDVPTYARVRYTSVYSGIDLLYYGKGPKLEYDFVVSPGAAPEQITLGYLGAESLELDPAGDLLVRLPGGTVRQERPLIYQEREGRREPVDGGYVLVNPAVTACDEPGESCTVAHFPSHQDEAPQVAFWLGAYDTSRPLVIDPTLVYSTYLGGSGDESGHGIAVDGQGEAYITGKTVSANFPNAIDAPRGDTDVFVTKLSAAGTPLYTTYLGGSYSDQGNAIAVDRSCMTNCSAFVTGYTYSPEFPQVNALSLPAQNSVSSGGYTAFVTRLSASGDTLLYSTYLGGSGNAYDVYPYCEPGANCDLGYWELPLGDAGTGIAVDVQGQAYVTGSTYSSDFPLANPLPTGDTLHGDGDAFVAKLSAAGNALVYSTYLGGGGLPASGGINSNIGIRDDDSGSAIAVDGQGQAYVTGNANSSSFPLVNPLSSPANVLRGGSDAFVAKLSAAGNALVYSTYLGGSGYDMGSGVAVDDLGQAYVTGQTSSPDFPQANNTLRGAADAFVTKFSAGGATLLYATYLGGSDGSGGGEAGSGIAVDGQGQVYVTGGTTSVDIPLVDPLPANSMLQGNEDAFVTKLTPDGVIGYSTYLGGSGGDEGGGIAVDSSGNAYVTGGTSSANFPTLNAGQPAPGGASDAFVAKLSPAISTAALSPSPTLSPTLTPSPSSTPSPSRTPSPTPTATPTPTSTPTLTPTATSSPTPTPTDSVATAKPTSSATLVTQPPAQTITFDDLLNPDRILNGQYPTGVIDWGSDRWFLSGPSGAFASNSVRFQRATSVRETIGFVVPRRLVQLTVYNRGMATSAVTVACAGQPTMRVVLASNQQTTLVTRWNATCFNVTLVSTNGSGVNFDNIVLDAG
jgi:hypothetical protein